VQAAAITASITIAAIRAQDVRVMAFSLLGHFDPQLAGRMVNRPYIATAFGENLAIRRNAPRTPRQKDKRRDHQRQDWCTAFFETNEAVASWRPSPLANGNHVGSAELQRRLSNFLAASAEGNGGQQRSNDDSAFQTLHGLLSSG
jgi:hypothetical protein